MLGKFTKRFTIYGVLAYIIIGEALNLLGQELIKDISGWFGLLLTGFIFGLITANIIINKAIKQEVKRNG